MAADPDPDEPAERPSIDWAHADVSDGNLRVPLTGELPRGLGDRLGDVLERLGGDTEQRWGKVKVAKGEIRVKELSEGAEADLRHELESALLQASADLGVGPAADQDAQQQRQGHADPEQERDERMTEAFRSFAAPPADKA